MMKIPRSKFDMVIDILCYLCLFGTAIFLLVIWHSIPQEIPGHYNAAGEIDKMSNKNTVWIVYGSAWIMYIFMRIVEHFPQIWNTGVQVTEENRERVYRVLKNLLGTIKFLCVGAFTFMTIPIATCREMPAWFTPVLLLAMFGSIIWHIYKLLKIK